MLSEIGHGGHSYLVRSGLLQGLRPNRLPNRGLIFSPRTKIGHQANPGVVCLTTSIAELTRW